MTIAEIVEAIKSMTILEVADLVKAIEDEFGVSAAPVAVAGGAAPAAGRCLSIAAAMGIFTIWIFIRQ